MSFTEVKEQVLRMTDTQQQKLMSLLLGVRSERSGNLTHAAEIRAETKLGWAATFREIATSREDWSAFDSATADGLDEN